MIRDMVARILAAGPWVRRTSLAGLGASLVPALSFGLGLGDIQVESRLNQPLYARIEVVDVTDDEWRQIRARVAPRTLSSEGSVHPEILASLTLRAVENGKGGHFIEVKSGEVLTEPLFELPVEVIGQSLRFVRNYSVLLDPATSDDAPSGVPAAVARPAGVASVARGADPVVGAPGHSSRGHHAHSARKLRKAAPGAINGAVPVAQVADVDAARSSMQATIASQNVEIARLTAQVAARSGPSASRRPSTWVEYPARKSEASSEGASDASAGWISAGSAMFYWIGGAIVGLVALVFGVVGFFRWRHARMLREIALEEAARRRSSPKPAVERTSERDLLAWQSNLRAAQSGSWKQSLEDTFDPASGAGSASHPEAPGSTITHANLEYALPGLEADLETLNASYEAERLENGSGGMAAWRAQNEMLEREYLSGEDETDSGFAEKVAI